MNQFNIEVDWKFTRPLTPKLACSKPVTVDRFQTNSTLIYSHGLSCNCSLRAATIFLQISGGECTRARTAKPRNGKNEGAAARDLQSRTFSHELGHLSVSRVSLEGLRKKRDCS